MKRRMMAVVAVFSGLGCSAADDGAVDEPVASAEQAIGILAPHVVPWVRVNGVPKNTRCPQGEFLRGMSGDGIVCELAGGNEWAGEPDVLRNPVITATTKIASCDSGGNYVAVGVIPSTNGLICKKLSRMLTSWSPNAANTDLIGELSLPSHELNYTTISDVGICARRGGKDGGIFEWAENRFLVSPGVFSWQSFYTCGL